MAAARIAARIAMTVHFLLGESGTGKTTTFINNIRQTLQEHPEGNPIIYLVPEQMTFLAEQQIAHTDELGGMIRTQVFSFTRLAWRVLQETGGISKTFLTEDGINMLLRKVIEDNKEQLLLFKKAANKNGFVKHIEQIMTELKRYNVTPDDLANRTEESASSENKVLSHKMNDLSVIYQQLESYLEGQYVHAEDYLNFLSNAIEYSDYLSNATLYVDGFHRFTPQEMLVLEKLICHTKHVHIALTLNQRVDRAQLFRTPLETLEQLEWIAEQHGKQVKQSFLTETKRFSSESLSFLQSNWETSNQRFEGNSDVYVTQAASRRAELEYVAREIRKKVKEEGLRFSQFAILTRNMKEYKELLPTVFTDYDIPFYTDEKRTMLTHPLIELIRATLDIFQGHWQYEAIFRAAKTEMFSPIHTDVRSKLDLLENYVLAHGIKEKHWKSKHIWEYRRFHGLEVKDGVQTDAEREIQKHINEMKEKIASPLIRLERALRKATTGREYCEALFLFLEALDVPQKLEHLSILAQEKGELLRATEHMQAWNKVVDLLDQFDQILGEEQNLTFEQFSVILQTGLESMEFSVIPPAKDQVIIANLELSRLSDIEVAFIIGMNDGVLPMKAQEEGLLTDEDRENLATQGLKLAVTSKDKLLDEAFVFYGAFTIPKQALYFTYPIANEEGKALLASPYIHRVERMITNSNQQLIANDPTELESAEHMSYIAHPTPTLSYVTSMLHRKKQGYAVPALWWDVYNYFISTPKWKPVAIKVFQSLYYENTTNALSQETSNNLYGEEISASVSRMEMFNSCAFSHFMSHGLKLQEREIFKLNAPNIGDLFHHALQWIGEKIDEQRLSWSTLTSEQCRLLAKESITALAPHLQNQILLSSNKYKYMMWKLEQIVGRASQILSKHASVSGFVPVGLEVDFGKAATLPPLTFQLKNGSKMQLRGRIDRVDKGQNEQGTYLRIIDFKSSARTLDLSEVYYGLSLQMLTYLDIVVSHSQQLIGEQALPAGVLYFHLHNPVVDTKKILTFEQIEKEIFKSFRMKGLLLGEEDVIQLMDTSLDGGKSDVISAELKKDGSLSARSQVTSEENFSLLRKHVRNVYQEAGDRIVTGDVNISPYQLNKRIPCEFCSFKSVCQFDQSLASNDYRVLQQKKPEDIIQVLRGES